MTIFHHFRDSQTSQRSYLIGCPKTRQALIVNPTEDRVEAYENVLRDRDLKLVFTLETHHQVRSFAALDALRQTQDASRIMPAGPNSWNTAVPGNREEFIEAGGEVTLGDLRFAVIEPPAGFKGDVAYRSHDYTFTLESVLIAYPGDSAEALNQAPTSTSSVQPGEKNRTISSGPDPIINYRQNRDFTDVNQLLLEDLHTSLIENRFSPKETQLVRAYLRAIEDDPSAPPSAADLSALLENADPGIIHVVVHGIRWKQIKRARLPLILAGQASKWLKAYNTDPEFTSHEKEFLSAYLELTSLNRRPPSGPEILTELSPTRCIQWVRKRAFTIRRKQREFGLPMLVLARKRPLTLSERPSLSDRRNDSQLLAS